MPDVFFTSDLHLGHAKILEYSKRPFSNVDEMNEALIDNWNKTVTPGGLIYVIGDFALTRPPEAVRFAQRLKGNKYLVFGNHDRKLRDNKPFLYEWIWARDYAEIEVLGQKIILMHYAMRVWNRSHHKSWQLFGHSHNSLPDNPTALQLDVGVDAWNYAPVSFDEIKERMSKKTFKPVDHHGARGEDEE